MPSNSQNICLYGCFSGGYFVAQPVATQIPPRLSCYKTLLIQTTRNVIDLDPGINSWCPVANKDENASVITRIEINSEQMVAIRTRGHSIPNFCKGDVAILGTHTKVTTRVVPRRLYPSLQSIHSILKYKYSLSNSIPVSS